MIKITFEDTVGEMKDNIEKYLKDNADNPTVMQICNQRMSHAVYGATAATDDEDFDMKEFLEYVHDTDPEYYEARYGEEYEKAIECVISLSDQWDTISMLFKFKDKNGCQRSINSLIATYDIEEFIKYLKQYTNYRTIFYDDRIGSSWNAFFDRVSYDCHIIEMDAENITLKHYDHSSGTINSNYKTERKCFEEVLDQIKDANIIYIHDETAW